MEGLNVAVNRLDGLGYRKWLKGPAQVIGNEIVLDERTAEVFFSTTRKKTNVWPLP
jgi:hypothetical protein